VDGEVFAGIATRFLGSGDAVKETSVGSCIL
jgi:hypothetical protein